MATSLLFQHLQQIGFPALQLLEGVLCSCGHTGDVAQCSGSSGDGCFGANSAFADSSSSTSGSSYSSSSRCRPAQEVCRCSNAGIACPNTRDCTTNGFCCNSCSSSSCNCSSLPTAGDDAPGLLSNSSNSHCCMSAECLTHRILSRSTPLVPPPPPYSADTNGISQCTCNGSHDPCCSSCSSCSGSSAAGPPENCLPISTRSIPSIGSAALATAVFFPRMLPLLRALWEAGDMTDWPLSSEGHSTRRRAVDLEVWKLRPNAELSTQLKLWGNAAMARGRPAAAASLYTAGTLLLPSSNNANTPSSNSLFAVLSANASLALLRLKRVRRALRTATEAVAADPMYRKAWHRRAAALVHLREGVERYFVPLGSNSSDRSSSSGSKTSHNTNYCTAAARACLQQIDREIAEAQMMSQGQANASEAATAARRMIVGCCGCGCSAAPRPSPEGSDPLSHSPNIWLRRDVSAQLGTKGWSLVTANDAPSRLENDPCLVLEEEALAVYVHPDLCTAVPKIPFLLPSHYKFATAQSPAQSAEGMKLHADAIVRDAWEQQVEEGAAGKKESEEREGTCLELKDETEGICAGCATVPAREQGAASECHLQEFDTWNSALSHFLYPTLPVVPCGSCTAALFCCHGCRAASSHKRSCRLQQQQQVQQQEVSGMEVCGGRSDNLRGTGGTAAASVADALVQPLALALPDSHRCIARQLLASLLPPTAASNELTEESGSTAFAKTPVQTAVELSAAPNSAGLSMIGEPPWCQLVVRASSVVVDSTRVADWLLNAAWLAGEAAASGRGLLCGARCLICRPAGREEASPSDSAFAAAASAAEGSTRRLDETDARHLCGCCCACCRLWCPKCSVRSLAMQDSGGLSRRGVPFPRCLFSAALHAYGVACCNSFTIRVLCDPEEEAIKAGTAVFLVASLLNHSCAPNAITAFGEPRIQLQHQQQRHPKQLCQHKREGDADSTAAQYANLIPSPRGVGRGALLQVRLCAPHNRGGSDRLQELCVSYGPVVGLPKSSWGFRQDWLLKHAGFFCRCEACLPPRGDSSAANAGNVAFRYELLCGLPCPICTSIPRARELLGGMQQNASSDQKRHELFDAAALLRRCLGSHHKLLAEQAACCSLFSKMPTKTLEFVTAFSELLLPVLKNGEGPQRWTSTQILALLGHSCAPLWATTPKAFPDSSAGISSFLGNSIPVYVFSELRCLNCNSHFPAGALERNREAIQAQLDRKQNALRSLVSPSLHATQTQRVELLTEVLNDILQAIPQAVAVSGCLSTDVWQALQSAARAAHAQAEVMRQVHTDSIRSFESVGLAATCMSAGIYVLLHRLPLGLSQPEVCAQMYKAAVLLGQVGGRSQAKQVLRAAIKATLNSCGPHSVSQSSMKEYLRWLEREDE